ncbi:MAG: ribonuclease P protein component [Armatimonadetes bacterium]|nr:ribonuclease P protein component [Armatimonadota bacterium]
MGLPRRWRLGETNRIRQILARGRRSGGAIGSLHVLPGAGTETRACLVFSRRVGNAVVRNRGRRRVQAALLGLEPRLQGGWDLVFRGRAACGEIDFMALRAALERLLVEARVPLASPPPGRE